MTESTQSQPQVHVDKAKDVHVNPPKESIFQWLMKWGGFGFVAIMFYIQFHMNHADERENRRISRESHEKTFEAMRQDNKDAAEYDRSQRSKANALIREGNHVLKEISQEQKQMVGALNTVIRNMKIEAKNKDD